MRAPIANTMNVVHELSFDHHDKKKIKLKLALKFVSTYFSIASNARVIWKTIGNLFYSSDSKIQNLREFYLGMIGVPLTLTLKYGISILSL